MLARYYDLKIGRFMGIDPAVFQEDNPAYLIRYAYAEPEAPEPEDSAFNHADWDGISSGAGTFEDWKDSVNP